MLSIITGRAKSGKTEKLFKLLKDNLETHTESLLFVPEQFSFNAEKNILNNYPDDLDKITVVSFTSFCNELKRFYGGNAGKIISDSTRIIFLHKAIKQLEGELQLFKTSNSAINSIETISSAIIEFKQAAVSSEELMNLSLSYAGTLLGMKLHDISLIMSTYDALIKNKYIDPNDDLDLAYAQAKNNGYFCDKAVYFHSYTGFTGQQYNIIKQALIDSDSVAVSLCTDNKNDDEFGIFANVNKTLLRIVNIAKFVGVKDIKHQHTNNISTTNLALQTVEKFISGNEFDYTQSDGQVVFNKFPNKYIELEYIASEIHRLVRTEGYRYRDFAVISGNIENYEAVASAVFRKLDVPIHLDKKLLLIETPIANFILSALRASKSYSTQEIIRFIKTGLTNFSSKEISDIDDYVFLWNIRSYEWNESWEKNPYGLSEEDAEKVNNKLEYLNSLRKRIISPLKEFNISPKASATEFCKKLYRILEKCNVSKNLSSYVQQLQKEGEHTETQYIISSWEAMTTILDDIVSCHGDDVISLTEFIEMLEFSFKKHSLGSIPQGLDEVYFAPASRIERSDFKVVFAFGMNYGEFPNYSVDGGLFNPYERGRLIGSNIDISDAYINSTIEENFLLYKALTSTDEKLYLSYRYSDYSGDSSEPSAEITGLAQCFGTEISPVENVNIETEIQAFTALTAGKLNEKSEAEISDSFKNNDYWNEKLKIVSSLNDTSCDYIDSNIAKKLYEKNNYTSASKIEQFYKCPYAYFIKHGLNISKPVQIDFKRMQRGRIIHYVLEKFIKDDLENFENIDENELILIINRYINEFIEKNMGSSKLLDEYSKYILKRILELLIELVPHVCSELSNSEFKPIEFEYDLKNEEIEPIKLKDNDREIRISGVVDRFDMYSQDGRDYVRIVDYKSGVKKIKLSDILYGLNLQMFIYINAICDSKKFKSIPAAVLYQPINYILRNGIDGEISDEPKISGVLTNDVDILQHMDPIGKFMPYKLKADGTTDKRSLCVSDENFRSIFKFVKNKIIDMNDSLLNGNISKDPCDSDGSHRVCDYCDYSDICSRSAAEVNRVAISLPNEEVLKIIEEENDK